MEIIGFIISYRVRVNKLERFWRSMYFEFQRLSELCQRLLMELIINVKIIKSIDKGFVFQLTLLQNTYNNSWRFIL